MAMAMKKLPRDFMTRFTGNHFLHDGYDKDEVGFQRAHKTACELVAETKSNYGDRRLAAMALPYTMFLLIEADVKAADDNLIDGLFVEVFGDKDLFYAACIKELDRSDDIISMLQVRQDEEEDDKEEEALIDDLDIPDTEEEKIKLIYDRCLKSKDKLVLTRYMKIFDNGHSQVLAITHAKIKDFDKIFSKLKF
jgi:hypothetical protein